MCHWGAWILHLSRRLQSAISSNVLALTSQNDHMCASSIHSRIYLLAVDHANTVRIRTKAVVLLRSDSTYLIFTTKVERTVTTPTIITKINTNKENRKEKKTIKASEIEQACKHGVNVCYTDYFLYRFLCVCRYFLYCQWYPVAVLLLGLFSATVPTSLRCADVA